MRVILIGANGFVGSAFHRQLTGLGHEVVPVVRATYTAHVGQSADLVIDAAGNSRKFFAEEKPVEEFPHSAGHALRVALDFPAACHLHISSVDVYANLTSPATTAESGPIDLSRSSHYGFHKLLAEQIVQHYRSGWLILRLAGMVGPGLRKNPVFDILHDQPLRIHPDSQYQFMNTGTVAEIALGLVESGLRNEVVNVCGDGLISPREIAQLAGRSINLSLLDPAGTPRIVDVNVEKLRARGLVPGTRDTVSAFLQEPQS